MKDIIKNMNDRLSARDVMRLLCYFVLTFGFVLSTSTPQSAYAEGLDSRSSGLLSVFAVWLEPQNDTGVPVEAIADYDAQNKDDADYLAGTSCVNEDGQNHKQWEMEVAKLEAEIAKYEAMAAAAGALEKTWKANLDKFKAQAKAIASQYGVNSVEYKTMQQIIGEATSAWRHFQKLRSNNEGAAKVAKAKLDTLKENEPEDCCDDKPDNSV